MGFLSVMPGSKLNGYNSISGVIKKGAPTVNSKPGPASFQNHVFLLSLRPDCDGEANFGATCLAEARQSEGRFRFDTPQLAALLRGASYAKRQTLIHNCLESRSC